MGKAASHKGMPVTGDTGVLTEPTSSGQLEVVLTQRVVPQSQPGRGESPQGSQHCSGGALARPKATPTPASPWHYWWAASFLLLGVNLLFLSCERFPGVSCLASVH